MQTPVNFENETVFHLHIPRTGGTSIRKLFVDNFGEDAFFDINGQRLHDLCEIMSTADKAGFHHKVISVHGAYGIHRYLPVHGRTFRYMTTLRHPAALVRSLYYYYLEKNIPIWVEAAKAAGSLRGWFRSLNRPRNSQSYMLCDYYGERNTAAALETLHNKIAFFGLIERPTETFRLLSRWVGLPDDAPPHENATLQDDAPDLSWSEMCAICEELDNGDMTIYRTATDLFNRRLDALGRAGVDA